MYVFCPHDNNNIRRVYLLRLACDRKQEGPQNANAESYKTTNTYCTVVLRPIRNAKKTTSLEKQTEEVIKLINYYWLKKA